MRSLILAICVAAVFAIWASGARAVDGSAVSGASSGPVSGSLSAVKR